jgi:hypothetical protein
MVKSENSSRFYALDRLWEFFVDVFSVAYLYDQYNKNIIMYFVTGIIPPLEAG